MSQSVLKNVFSSKTLSWKPCISDKNIFVSTLSDMNRWTVSLTKAAWHLFTKIFSTCRFSPQYRFSSSSSGQKRQGFGLIVMSRRSRSRRGLTKHWWWLYPRFRVSFQVQHFKFNIQLAFTMKPVCSICCNSKWCN